MGLKLRSAITREEIDRGPVTTGCKRPAPAKSKAAALLISLRFGVGTRQNGEPKARLGRELVLGREATQAGQKPQAQWPLFAVGTTPSKEVLASARLGEQEVVSTGTSRSWRLGWRPWPTSGSSPRNSFVSLRAGAGSQGGTEELFFRVGGQREAVACLRSGRMVGGSLCFIQDSRWGAACESSPGFIPAAGSSRSLRRSPRCLRTRPSGWKFSANTSINCARSCDPNN